MISVTGEMVAEFISAAIFATVPIIYAVWLLPLSDKNRFDDSLDMSPVEAIRKVLKSRFPPFIKGFREK